MRTVTILGSTGSIGTQTLDLIQAHADRYDVVALTAHDNVERLAEQARLFNPSFVAIGNPDKYAALKNALSDKPEIKIGTGPEALVEAASMDADWTMAAILGVAALHPTLAAIKRGKIVAFASKECLVAAGSLMMAAVKQSGATFLPVDSEHNAIYQVWDENNRNGVERIVLTASGGPFREYTLDQMRDVTPEQALAHPTWSMGAKISIDSATMMNKALEVIEAHHLFNMPGDKIDVLVHPQSVVHSLVEYIDGSFLAQMGPSDMRTPIAYCLGWPERVLTSGPKLDLAAMRQLSFENPDVVRFPALSLVYDVLARGPASAIAFNAANEVAVQEFLQKRIGFTDIMGHIERAVEHCHNTAIDNMDDVVMFDSQIREEFRSNLKNAA